MKIKVMTFNIRYDTPLDKINCFDGRKPLIKDFLTREKPHLIGFQEVLPHVRDWLNENFPDYILLGAGRDESINGEGVSIAYRKDLFDLFNFREFWLSETPNKPGSRFHYDQSDCPRTAVLATLVCKNNGKLFTFANTHLDHIGAIARIQGATLLLSRIIGENDYPFILTGDFNASPDSTEIKLITHQKGVIELTSEITKDMATFHNYGEISSNSKIDYIFSSDDFTLCKDSITLHTDNKNGVWLSDHYPISVTVEL